MLDLITTQSLNAGNAVQARQSNLAPKHDTLFEDSLRLQDRTPVREIEPKELSESDRQSSVGEREVSELSERVSPDDETPQRDLTDPDPKASTDTEQESGPPPHPVENEPADEVASPETETSITETKPSAELQALAWQEHMLSLARLARGTRSEKAEASGSGEATSNGNAAHKQATLIESKPAAVPTQQHAESTRKNDDSSANVSEQQSSVQARATTIVSRESVQNTESSQQQSVEGQSKLDGAFLADFSQEASNQSASDSKQQTDSRLLSSLKQSAKSTSTASTQVDPFALKEPLTQSPPPTAVVRPTIATNQTPIHLQSIDTSAQGVSESQGAQERGNIAAVTRGLAAAVRQRGGTVNIQLTPEALGPIKITMSIQQGNVSVHFDAATEQARELLQKNIESLRTTLQGKGFGVERLAVQSSHQSFDSGTRDSSGQSQQDRLTQSNQHDASEGESRGRREHDDPDAHEQQQSTEFTHHWRVAVNTTA